MLRAYRFSDFFIRFGHLFDEDDLLMATATHPAQTLHAINNINETAYTTIKNRVIREMVELVESDSDQEEAGAGDKHFCYDDLYGGPGGPATAPSQHALEESIKHSAINWARTREHVVKREHFPEGHRETWIKLFIRYNTALPSSAAAERLFSTAGNILRPKRSSLTASNFEQLVLLKGNSRMFKAALKEDLKKGPDADQDQE